MSVSYIHDHIGSSPISNTNWRVTQRQSKRLLTVKSRFQNSPRQPLNRLEVLLVTRRTVTAKIAGSTPVWSANIYLTFNKKCSIFVS